MREIKTAENIQHRYRNARAGEGNLYPLKGVREEFL